MRSRFFGLAAVLLLTVAAMLAMPAFADEIVIYGSDTEKPLTPEGFNPQQMVIGVDSTEFFVLRTAAAGYTLAQRACIVDLRITEALSLRLTGPVTVKRLRGRPTLYIGPVRLVTVYPEDVAAAGACCAWHLAQKWAAGVREGLPKVVPGAFPRQSAGEVGVIALGGKLLFVLHWANGFGTVEKRHEVVEQRVTEALSRRAGPVHCRPVAGGIGVYAGDMLIVEATDTDAEALGVTKEKLADRWAANLEEALKLIAAKTPEK